MESRRYLRCLGHPALFTAAGEPIRFRTKKHLALLVYLGVEAGSVQRRDRLAELLWPKVTLPEARHSLATALSILRSRLGPEALETTRDEVLLASGRLALDLDRLAAGDILGTEVTGPLEVGAFLDGFEIPDAGEFALWKDRQQARLLPAIKAALVVLIDRCRRTGDSRQIEHLADRMLALDELSEEAIRAKMEARAFAGDRLTALKIFEAWKDKLGEELGAVPSDLVEGMAVRLRRRGWERTTRSDIPSVPTDQWRNRPFIGRSTEYRALYEAWEGLRAGVPAHAIVLGDSGIGKTTLVERLTTAAGLEGAAISRVQCYDLEREIPYATVGGLVHGLLDRPGVSATPPEALAELGRTVPKVRNRFPNLPPSGDSQGETARIRLTESFHQMVQAIAEEHPVILVVDDLHLADDASLAVLHLVMRRARGEPVMVILIARPGELPQAPQAARLWESAARLGIREIELSPLREDESRELLSSLVPSDQPQPSASVRRRLLRAAGGFPMVLELLVQDWQANGDQSLALAVDAMTVELEKGGTPVGTYGHLFPRMSRFLDARTHNVLNLAAILGHRLNDLQMYGVMDLSLGQTIAGLRQLTELRLLRESAHGLDFTNELIRAYAYASVPAPVRRVLHGRVVDRLLREAEHDGTASGLEIAWHLIRAARTKEATPHLLRGARDAIQCGAPDAAERALTSALPSLRAKNRVDAIFLLVEALQEQGRWLESLDYLTSLTAREVGDRNQEMLVFEMLAKLHPGSNNSADIVDQLPALIEVIRTSRHSGTRARAGRIVAHVLAENRDQEGVRNILDLMDSIPDGDLDPDSIGLLALTKGLLLYHVGDTRASLSKVTEAIAELRRSGVASCVMAQLEGGLGSIKARQGEYEEAVIHNTNAYKRAISLGNDRLAAGLAGNLALCCGRLGHYSEQLHWVNVARSYLDPASHGYLDVQLTYSMALAHAMIGRADLAIITIAQLEPRLSGEVPSWIVQAWGLWKADLLLLCGRKAEAQDTAFRELERHAFNLLSDAYAGPFARWIALTSERTNNSVMAFNVVSQLAERIAVYDALDQVEILCAKHYLSCRLSYVGAELPSELRAKLASLRPSIRAQLERWEMLPGST
jgi:DNA-binding SARP family transcriptional activator/type II secretory pathway predicted ATPase ExeA/tetratricopeptide (TPR) repeat protein